MNDAATPTITVTFEITEEDAINLAKFLLGGLDAAAKANEIMSDYPLTPGWAERYLSICRSIHTILLALPH